MLRRKHLLQLHAELELADDTARFHIGEDFFQIADACSQLFHFAQAGVHARKLVRDGAEAGRQPLIQCVLQLFINDHAHFVELCRVVRVQCAQAGFDRGTQAFSALPLILPDGCKRPLLRLTEILVSRGILLRKIGERAMKVTA